ncbi:MAG TPA: TadE/TadG family type IV pilus assembly protein [bacterium]|nr:TadE/TadG family type IV pilus assembly protein [bacterium]
MQSAILERRTRRHQGRFECGQAVVEFAFILPLLLILVFGITELGRMLMRTNVLTQAAREGARAAAVGVDSASVVSRVEAILSSAGVDATDNPVVDIAPADANGMINVTVTCEFDVVPGRLLPFSGTLTLRGASAMRKEN